MRLYHTSDRIIREPDLTMGRRNAECDLIMGPIASDTLFETYGIITSGLLTQEQALELLAIGPDYTQVAIRTERAAMQLVWKGSYTLDEAAMETARMNYDAAKERFDSEFGAAMDRMDIE